MKNHLGSYECKLCLTLHNNEVSSQGPLPTCPFPCPMEKLWQDALLHPSSGLLLVNLLFITRPRVEEVMGAATHAYHSH